MMKKKWIVMLLSGLFIQGCSSGLKQQLTENETTIQQLRNEVIDLNAKNKGLEEQLKDAKQGRIPSGVIAVEAGSLRGGIYQNVSEGTVVSTNGGADFDNALQLYRAGDIDGAINGLQQYLATGGTDEKAALAQYWLGDANYTKRNYEGAARYLGTFLKNMPQSDKTSSALKKLITSLRALGRNSDADVLQKLGVSAIQ